LAGEADSVLLLVLIVALTVAPLAAPGAVKLIVQA
jgi:hypothetical protein